MRLPTRARRRNVAIGSAAALILLVVGAIVVRRDSGAADQAASRPTVPATTTVTAASSPGSGPAAPAVTVEGSAAVTAVLLGRGEIGDVEVPVDPSGARGRQNEDGARQSAIDYVSTVRQRLVYLTGEYGRQVLTDWASPGVAATAIDSELAQAEMLRSGLSADGGDVWWLVSPLATRVDAYSGERARVSVWLSSVIGAGADPAVSSESTQPMVRYQTDTVELVWSSERWTVWSTTSVDGPTPMLAPSMVVATPEVFITSMDGFSLVRTHH